MSWTLEAGVLRSARLEAIPSLASAVLLPGTPADALSERCIDLTRVCRVEQMHGVMVRDWFDPRQGALTGDGIVVRSPGQWAEIRTADCVPLILVARKGLAVVHAGWRGTLAGIASQGVKALGEAPYAAILGPHIRSCCYEVDADLAERFTRRFGGLVRDGRDVRPRLNLAEALRTELSAAGLAPENIDDHAPCTHCDPRDLPSWRRQGQAAGRIRTIVGYVKLAAAPGQGLASGGRRRVLPDAGRSQSNSVNPG